MVIRGPFNGDLRDTSVKIGGQEVEILAESPRMCVVVSYRNVGPGTEVEIRESKAVAKRTFRSEGNEYPEWLTDLIDEFENQPVANPPLSIVQYKYGGAIVYYVPPRCCDIASDLYDADGKLSCHPGGGFTGEGDGRCPDFQGKNGKLVWKDQRSY